MTKPEPIKPDDYLELFRISDCKYIIGIFESGITFYKQQIRALNIFDALKKTKKIPESEDFTIAVIGGGIAGLTFAAAALKSKHNVILFEEGSQTLNIQAGCNIRDIHPYLYDWPERHSTQTRTNLPILNWHHDTAANVVRSVKKEFTDIKDTALELKSNCYFEYCNVKELQITDKDSGKRFEINGATFSRYGDQAIHKRVDLIMYAIGYGIEKGISAENKFESYWRDTSIKQDDLSKCNYIIQGTGDGALIDLFNILIRDFSYESFLEILHGNIAGRKLFQKLMKIREKRLKSKSLKEELYENEFMNIAESEFEYILDEYNRRKLFTKLDASVNVYLFGLKDDFYKILDYSKISFINAFIAFILFSSKKFSYGKDLDPENPEYLGKPIDAPRKMIIRVGTDKDKVIAHANFSGEEAKHIKELAELQTVSAAHGIVEPHWEKFDFNSYFDETGRLHHLSKKTKSLCSVFVDILGSSLADHYDEKKDLRVTVHRVLSIDGDLYYQRLTPYAPLLPGHKKKDHKVGTIYEIDRGNVGYTITTGKPLLVKNIDQEEFDSLMSQFNVDRRYDTKYSPKTILTIPIMAKYEGAKSGFIRPYNSTNAVIYMDSSDLNFFDGSVVQNMIMRLCDTFVNTLNVSLKSEDLVMADVDFEPPRLTRANEIKNKCVMKLDFFEALNKIPLTIDRYSSFEMLPWN
ncbi:FAD-binding protein [Mucilaginibacter sp.]|uniref:FAD-binding protein n=1 Tax=Mucilaginibacter sp. TaxID=1882438 RepID=UPI0032635B5D